MTLDEQHEPSVSSEFIEENRSVQLARTIPKAGGPYSKGQRRKRRQEVHRLHFELGLSALKIAEMLKVSRHTVNQDIRWLYEQMATDIEGEEFSGYFAKQLVRLETQRTRLMSYLSDAEDLEAKLGIERQLAEMDFHLAAMVEKFKENTFAFWDTVVEKINELAESEGLDRRYTNFYELNKISKTKRKAIDQALEGGQKS
jgi:DNA-binding CsgD family transcriptional regulator